MRFMTCQGCLIRNFEWVGAVILLFLAYASWAASGNNTEYLLVTGFEPFQGAKTNGSWEAVQNLDGKHFGKITVVVAQLPVVWGEATEKLHGLIKANNPVAVISFGQAGEEPVRLETIAHNVRESILDNKNKMPQALQIYSHAASALKTGLPITEIESRLRTAGIPVQVSQDAGTYLCNDMFYTLMHDPGTDNAKNIPRGFVHVPPLNARVRTEEGNEVIFDKRLLQETAEIIIQAVAGTSAQSR